MATIRRTKRPANSNTNKDIKMNGQPRTQVEAKYIVLPSRQADRFIGERMR